MLLFNTNRNTYKGSLTVPSGLTFSDLTGQSQGSSDLIELYFIMQPSYGIC